jgi:WD40 repeat protein
VATGNEIVLLDAATLTEMGRLRGHTDGVIEARFSHDGTLLASGSADESVILWDVATGERRAQLTGHAGAVWGVAFSPDDSTLYTTGLDDSLLSWDLRGDRRSVPRQLLVEPVTDANFSVEGSPTGAAVAYFSLAAGDDGQDPTALVRFLDVGDGRAAPAIDTGHVTYGAYSWRPDGEQLATAGADGFVRLWDWQIGQVVRERQVAPGHIAGLDYTGDGKHLVVAERDGRLSAIDAETLEPAGTPVDIDDDLVWAFAGPDLTTSMATGVLSFTLVDLRSGRVIEEGDIGFNPQIGDFTADGRRFAITGVNGEVRVLDVRRGEWVGPARVGHDGPAGQAAFAPDGATFVTSGADGSVGLWDGATGAPLGAVVPGRPDVYVQARFLPDGHTVLMSSMDGTVSTWDTRPDRWAEHACAIAGRNLTLEEWRDVLPARPYGATCPEHASDG